MNFISILKTLTVEFTKINHTLSVYLGANVDFVLLLRRVSSYEKGIGTGLLEQVQLHTPRLSDPLPKHHGVTEKSQIIREFKPEKSNFYEIIPRKFSRTKFSLG